MKKETIWRLFGVLYFAPHVCFGRFPKTRTHIYSYHHAANPGTMTPHYQSKVTFPSPFHWELSPSVPGEQVCVPRSESSVNRESCE